jgi:chloramphenicol 3-O-phosphotransferase
MAGLVVLTGASGAGKTTLARAVEQLQAHADMMNWARYLRDEAASAAYEILDTSNVPLEECRDRIVEQLRARSENFQQS